MNTTIAINNGKVNFSFPHDPENADPKDQMIDACQGIIHALQNQHAMKYHIENKVDPIVEQVINKFKQRSEVGIAKYNTTLHENNSDDFLKHLQEELMDAVNYIQKLMSKEKTIKGYNFINVSKNMAINSYGDVFKLGEHVKHQDPEAGTTFITKFSVDDEYGEIVAHTELGIANIDFISHV